MTVRRDTRARQTRTTQAGKPNPRTSGETHSFSTLHRRISDALDARPLVDYTTILTIVLVLTGLGIVMVFSSSMAVSFANSASVWATALKQAFMVSLGLVAFWIMLRMSPQRVRSLADIAMVVSILMLVLVLVPGIGTGKEEVGSQSWILLGPLRFQPSEMARVAIAVWGAKILANKDPNAPTRLDNGFAPFIGVAGLCVLLIALQGDLGMAASFALVIGIIVFFAGMSSLLFLPVVLAALAVFLAVFLQGGFRSHRFHVYFDALFGHFEDTRGVAFQSHQGFLSLGDGSLFGVGLGQSRAKWFYLPEARNDFIFAVIGEELGLWGGALVISLFCALLVFGLRTARRARNQYQALLAAALTAGLVAQAFSNIGYVVGLLPVTGIQLPMLSAGGTSAVITLASMGILASVARHEPDAVSAMQNYGRPLCDRIFFIPEPTSPGQARTRAPKRVQTTPKPGTRAEREARFGTPVTARRYPHSARRTAAAREYPRRDQRPTQRPVQQTHQRRAS
ncbi:FtsW/RodA/SpoVE family cell cycle protein [Corynebacterium mayonis]|uniref:FtsW/RodA/SpoVE family cell cycle protein n=1 Tax=Corynebacterium mayonis TaxID=3062461 RepID=UPI0031406ED9